MGFLGLREPWGPEIRREAAGNSSAMQHVQCCNAAVRLFSTAGRANIAEQLLQCNFLKIAAQLLVFACGMSQSWGLQGLGFSTSLKNRQFRTPITHSSQFTKAYVFFVTFHRKSWGTPPKFSKSAPAQENAKKTDLVNFGRGGRIWRLLRSAKLLRNSASARLLM